VLEKVQETVVRQAIDEGFIIDETVAIDATHFEARDQAPTKKKRNLNQNLRSVVESRKKSVNNG